jgi:hypothetical protein
MTNVGWSPYDLPVTLLSSELNGLANNAISVISADTVNSTGRLYCDFEFVAGAAFTPGSNAILDIWMLRSIDNGVSFEDGSSSQLPPRDPDLSIVVRAGTSIIPRAGAPLIVLPVGHYKALARNRLGAAVPTGSIVRMAGYTEQAI